MPESASSAHEPTPQQPSSQDDATQLHPAPSPEQPKNKRPASDESTRRQVAKPSQRRPSTPALAATWLPIEIQHLEERFRGVDYEQGELPEVQHAAWAITRQHREPRFVLGTQLGRGGQGVVYQVADLDTGRQIAWKVMRGRKHSANHIARFIHEAQVTAQLEHPGIVPVHDIGALSDGTLYYTMKSVGGLTLDKWVRQHRESLTMFDLLQPFFRVCEALQFAHEQGVIHRDLKPGNIMVGDYGEALILDWGLSRVIGRGDVVSVRSEARYRSTSDPSWQTMDGHAVGTPAYMSPEQASGQRDSVLAPADVYSLGVILYEMLTGRSPYNSTVGDEVLQMVVDGRWQRLHAKRDAVPPPLVAVVHRAMSYHVEERYPTVAALAADLRAYLVGTPVSAYHENLWERLARNCRRHKAVLRASGLATTVVVAVVLAVMLIQAERSARELESLRKQALALEELGQFDGARGLWQQVIGRLPDDIPAQRGLERDRVRREEDARQAEGRLLRDQRLREVSRRREEVERTLENSDEQQALHLAESLGEALGIVPENAAEAREAVLALRDKVLLRVQNFAAERARAEARAQLKQVETLVAQRQWRAADRALVAPRKVLPDDPQVEKLGQQVEAGLSALIIEERINAAENLRQRAEQQQGFDQAIADLDAALAMLPANQGKELRARILAQRDGVQQRQRAAEDERLAAKKNKEREVLVQQFRTALGLGQLGSAQAAQERLRDSGADPTLVQSLRNELDAAYRAQAVAEAERFVAEAGEHAQRWREGMQRAERLRAELRQLRERDQRNAEDRRQEWEWEQELNKTEVEMAQAGADAGQSLLAARLRADFHKPVRRAIADYYAKYASWAESHGDIATALAASTFGRTFDDDQVHRLLFNGLSLVRNIGDHAVELAPVRETQERVLSAAQVTAVIAPGASAEVPAGRYQALCDSAVRTLLLRRGETRELDAISRVDLPPQTALVPGGTSYDAEGRASKVGDIVAAVYEVTCGEYLEFLNDILVRGRPDATLLLYPRDPSSPGESLWARRSGGQFVLRTRQGQAIDPRWPVTGISHDDAEAYARWRAARDGLPWRLPTGPEWRLIAQAGDGRAYPWGEYADISFCHSAQTHDPQQPLVGTAVGSYPLDRSPQGVFDLAGSVAEFIDGGNSEWAQWCGGGFLDNDPARMRTASERAMDRRLTHPLVGFRLVCTAADL